VLLSVFGSAASVALMSWYNFRKETATVWACIVVSSGLSATCGFVGMILYTTNFLNAPSVADEQTLAPLLNYGSVELAYAFYCEVFGWVAMGAALVMFVWGTSGWSATTGSPTVVFDAAAPVIEIEVATRAGDPETEKLTAGVSVEPEKPSSPNPESEKLSPKESS